MATELRDRLTDLAAQTPHSVPAADLWQRGVRRRRLDQVGSAALVAVLVLLLGAGGLAVRTDRSRIEPVAPQGRASVNADPRSHTPPHSRDGSWPRAPGPEWSLGPAVAPPRAGWSKCRSDRSSRRPTLQAQGRYCDEPAPRIARPCLRSKDSSADRHRRCALHTPRSDADWRG